jgi:hypothetical protein
VRRLRHVIPDTWTRDQLVAVMAWLEEHGALDALAATPEGSGLTSVARRLRRDLASLRAPPVTFTIPAGWERVETAEALWSAGRMLRNCLAFGAYGTGERIEAMMTGREVYLLNATHEAVVRLRHVGGRAWSLVETGARANAVMAATVERDLADALRCAGVVLLMDDVGSALDHLLRPLRRRPDLVDAEDVDAQDGAREAAA